MLLHLIVKENVSLCYHKWHITNINSNGNHTPPISKIIGYRQVSAQQVNTAVPNE